MNTNLNLLTSRIRIGGIASGLDTEQMISDLMRVERVPLDRLAQKKQLAEWRRDEYRNVINLIRGIKDEYFNVVKSSNYLLSQSTYKKFSAASSDSTAITATAGTGALPGNYQVTIKNLATASQAASNGSVSVPLQSNSDLSGVDFTDANGKSIIVTVDGVTKKITIGSAEGAQVKDLADLVDDLNTKLRDAFGTYRNAENEDVGKVIVNNVNGTLTFNTQGGASKITITDDSSNGGVNNGLPYLDITSSSSNRINLNETLQSLVSKFDANESTIFDENGNIKFSINSKEFTFSKTTTLSSIINTINSDADAKVTMMYDEITDKFIMTSKELGAGNSLDIAQAEGSTGEKFFSQVLKISTANIKRGEDATVVISDANGLNPTEIRRGSNNFTVNNITLNLVKADVGKVHTIKVEPNVDGIFDSIKGFIDKYNELIDTINGKLSEKYEREYQPLTEEQKNALSEKEAEKWEQKAKTGLLRNDSLLEKFVLDIRKALFDSIKDVDINLTSIGITTGRYEEKGKLKIDEEKLKEAIKNNPDGVANLFNKKSDKYPSYSRTMTSDERTVRYNESGLAQRLYDIIENNISTIRDADGKKGFLLEKAGIEGDASEFTNLIYKEIRDYDKSIDALYEKLIKKENSYFMKFAAMERILGQMNAQSNWLSAQLGLANK